MQNVHNLHAEFAVKRARRFVRKNDFGVVYDGSCDCNTLHLSARKLVGLFIDFLMHVDLVQCGNRLCPSCFLFLADKAQCEFDVFKNRKMRNEVVALKNKTYRRIAISVPVLVVKIRSGNSADDEVARRVSVKSADDVEHGRFAATARAENSHKFALSEIERNFSQCMHGCRRGGIIFYYVFKLKHIAPQKNALFYILFNNLFFF